MLPLPESVLRVRPLPLRSAVATILPRRFCRAAPASCGAAGQIGVDQRGLDGIAGFGPQGHPAVGVEPAAAEIGG